MPTVGFEPTIPASKRPLAYDPNLTSKFTAMYRRYVITLDSSQKIQEVEEGWIVSFGDLLQFLVRIFTNT
jgi:hypothetical protein